MGHACSLLFSLPKDKANLNNDTLFLVTRITHSYTLSITNFQLVLNTLSGLALKILLIDSPQNVKSCCSFLIKTIQRCHFYCMNHTTWETSFLCFVLCTLQNIVYFVLGLSTAEYKVTSNSGYMFFGKSFWIQKFMENHIIHIYKL
jgi:hypothetical protein